MLRALPAVLAMLFAAAACSDSGPSACAAVVDEEFDTQSSIHVAPDTAVEFLTWPPTSGPHVAGTPPSGVVTEPLSGSLQVKVLEDGKVLIQYEDIPERDVDKLAELAGENVVVAPGVDLPEPVVTTAWTTKQVCTEVDTGAHREFIEVYALPEPAN